MWTLWLAGAVAFVACELVFLDGLFWCLAMTCGVGVALDLLGQSATHVLLVCAITLMFTLTVRKFLSIMSRGRHHA